MPPQFSDDEIFLMQSTLVELCEARRDRIALLDPTATMAEDAGRGFPLLTEWRSRFDTRHAALYYPWLHVVDPLAVAPTRRVPPCGHVAGLYAAFDLEVGVHRAPANRILAWAEDTSADVDDARHGELNTIGINVVRTQPGFGLRVLGARTLSSDPTWRFVNVRRLVMMIMKAIGVATQWAVFEPNDHPTRTRITQALSEFFTALWARGALVGPDPQQAFVVRCDEVNNPPEARADGRLLAEVAIAPSQPFEFIVLRVGRQGNAFEIEEGARA
jgi:phage tail sheath protein FI